MNTPRSKKPIRYTNIRGSKHGAPTPDGRYTGGLWSDRHAMLVGQIVTYLPHLEERMIEFLALLLGNPQLPARQIFRSIVSEHVRLQVIRNILECTPMNKDRGPEYDEVINLFVTVKNKRNAFAHGLWHTHESGRVFLSEPTPEEFYFIDKREVTLKEIEADVRRMNELWDKVRALTHPDMKPFPKRIVARRKQRDEDS